MVGIIGVTELMINNIINGLFTRLNQSWIKHDFILFQASPVVLKNFLILR